MNDEDVKRVVEQKHRKLVERYNKLERLAEERESHNDPFHTVEETRAEAEGVKKGISACEEILEAITANEQDLPQ